MILVHVKDDKYTDFSRSPEGFSVGIIRLHAC